MAEKKKLTSHENRAKIVKKMRDSGRVKPLNHRDTMAIHIKARLCQGWTYSQIMAETGCTKSTIERHKKVVKAAIDDETALYKQTLEHRLLQKSAAAIDKIDDDKLANSSAKDLATVAGIFIDKVQKGQAMEGGANNGVILQVQQVFGKPMKEAFDE